MAFIDLMGPDIKIEFQGKEYRFGALTFKDLAEYLIWYQYRELHIQEKITKNLPLELRTSILKDTHEKCLHKKWQIKDDETGEVLKTVPLSWETPEVQESLSSPDGIAYQTYLSLRINHPEITEELAGKICGIKKYDEITSKLATAAGLIPDKPGELNPNQ